MNHGDLPRSHAQKKPQATAPRRGLRYSRVSLTRGRADLIALVIILGSMVACGPGRSPAPASDAAATVTVADEPATAATPPTRDASWRDLSSDEAHGGHTLARHTAQTNQQLTKRLQRERQISSASTYTDQPTAERVVGAAIAASHSQLERWLARKGARPNLTLHYRDAAGLPIGRSIRRGRRGIESCDRALVVLKWDAHRTQYFVLTSYPEAAR
jgi:Bacterial CdiA-CT RNAse A domain